MRGYRRILRRLGGGLWWRSKRHLYGRRTPQRTGRVYHRQSSPSDGVRPWEILEKGKMKGEVQEEYEKPHIHACGKEQKS